MIRRPPRSTLDRSSAASDVYKRQVLESPEVEIYEGDKAVMRRYEFFRYTGPLNEEDLSLIHISEPTRPY